MKVSKILENNSKRISFLILTSAFSFTLYYVINVSSGIPLEDEWRWLRDLLIPYSNGDLSIGRYLLGEYAFLVHSHFPALVLLLLSYHFFGLSFYPFVIVGLFSYFVLYLWLLRSMWLTSSPTGASWGWLVAAGVAFCISTSDFPWLLVVFEYFYLSLAFALMLFCDRFLRNDLSLFPYSVIVICVILFGDAIGLTAIVTVLGVSLLAMTLKPSLWLKVVAQFLLVGFLFLLEFVFLGFGEVGTTSGKSNSISHSFIENVGLFLQTLPNYFSQGLLDNVVLVDLFGSVNAISVRIFIGTLGLLAVSSALVLYLVRRIDRYTYMPILMIAYSLINWLAIVLVRVQDFGPDVFLAQRYTRLPVMAIIGVCWVGLLVARDNNIWMKLGPLAAIAMLILFVLGGNYQLNNMKYVNNYFNRANELIYDHSENQNTTALGNHIHYCSDGRCNEVIELMKKREIGLFHLSKKSHSRP